MGESDWAGSYGSFGSAASGSAGFYMAIWKWAVIATVLCCCCGGLAFCCGGKRAKKKPSKKKVAPPAAPEPVAQVEDSDDLDPLLPPLIPNRNIVPMPMTTAVPVSAGIAVPPMSTAM